ncbi:MAG: diadenylate cyclase CdaA [Lachnospiraceae bacterium]|nr:diadenylate cyclase CdaA [Lachnospiraceae bacterium]
MRAIANSIDAFFTDYLGLNMPSVHGTDIIEILIIAFFFYQLLVWFKNTRAWMLFRGLMVVIVFFVVAAMLQMNTILWLGEKLLNVALFMVIVVFQPELRKALEDLGRKSIFSFLSSLGFGKGMSKRFEDKTVSDLVMASFEMGAVKTGALIVVENEMRLDECERTGIILDSVLSRQLLINIFEKNTPLHDGAVIVRGDRVVAATCYLPLSENTQLSKELGTRHRAAIGMSEVCDAFVIVVSEETGQVSVAQGGELKRDLTDEQLLQMLRQMQHPIDEENTHTKSLVGRRAKHETKHEA